MAALLGLWARAAAACGLLLSLGFMLTVSWHSRPYYYGADIVFVFAWTPLVLAGAGRLSLDAVAAARARTDVDMAPARPVTLGFEMVQRLCGFYDQGRCNAQRGRRCGPHGCPVLAPLETPSTTEELDRRTFIARAGWAGWAAVSALAAGGFTAVAGRLISPRGRQVKPPTVGAPPSTPRTPSRTTSPPGTLAPAPGALAPTTAVPTTPVPVVGTAIGSASSVPVGGAASFSDPGTGDPSFVVQPTRGRFVAFNATCTHQGCPVQYSGSQFQCPCHGAAFDSATGAVLQGPAQRPLTAIQVQEGPDGRIYVR